MIFKDPLAFRVVPEPYLFRYAAKEMESAGYSSIPKRTAFGNVAVASPLEHGSDNQVRHRFRVSLLGRKLFLVLGIAAALAAVIFLTDNGRARFKFRESRLIPRTYSPLHSKSLHIGGRNSHSYLHNRYFDWKERDSRSSQPAVKNAIDNGFCDDDYDSYTAAMYSNACSRGLVCHARVVVNRIEAGIEVQFGYKIFPYGSGVQNIDEETKRRVKALTLREATKLAEGLFKQVASRLEEVDCAISVPMITNAIMETKEQVARCTDTSDRLCKALKTVRECSCEPEVEIDQHCYQYLASNAKVSSFFDLEAGCPGAYFSYTGVWRVWVELPYCTFTCPSERSVVRTFDAEFTVEGLKGMSSRLVKLEGAHSLASAIPHLYERLVLPLPSCDDALSLEQFGGLCFHQLSKKHLIDPTDALKRLLHDDGPQQVDVFFLSHVTATDYISSVC